MTAFNNRRCTFCREKALVVDYKNITALNRFTTRYAKIKPKYYSGLCLKHQKNLARAVKNARFMALIPYTQ